MSLPRLVSPLLAIGRRARLAGTLLQHSAPAGTESILHSQAWNSAPSSSCSWQCPVAGAAQSAWYSSSTRWLHGSPSQSNGYVQRWEDVSNDSDQQVDPYTVVSEEVAAVGQRLRAAVLTNIPALEQAAEYFFRPGVTGKRLRPTLLLLLASATSEGVPAPEFLQVDTRPPHVVPKETRRRQQRMAEIAELIHAASLLHDDVLDDATTRRGISSLNAIAGNKLAILAGDFLLARATVSLASLHNVEVMELMSGVVENLVSGEVMQMTAAPEELVSLDHYMRKTFCKTASLMANSARSVALVGNQPPEVCDAAWEYGRHLGLAFQIVDDILDLTASSSILGKPALNDMKSGIATAPVLFAAKEHPALVDLIQRKFKRDGDVAAAMRMVESSNGLARARELAAHHAAAAASVVQGLPAAQGAHAEISREALIRMTERVLTRSK